MDGLGILLLAAIAVMGIRLEKQRKEILRLKAVIREFGPPETRLVEPPNFR